jgi:hypothetical protein
MIAETYASMCGVELWNRARLHRYMSNGIGPPKVALRCQSCEGLEDLIPCIEDRPPEVPAEGLGPGYQLPELDPAPWYDPAAPASADFAGLLVLETKLSQPLDRRMQQNIGHGGTLTRMRFEGRTLYVRGILVGKTCCATAYGLNWLTQALLGDECDGCTGCSLVFLTCTPSTLTDCESLMVYDETGAHVPYFRTGEESEWERGTDFVRQMFGTGLMQAPEVISERSGGACQSGGCGCGIMAEVEFTIGIGNPWMYGNEVLVVEDQLLGGCETETCQINFVDDPDCDPFDPCWVKDALDCDEDPDCVGLPKPPPSGRMPLVQCGCIPLVVGHNCVQVPGDREWFDQALVIEVYAGSEPLRKLSIQAWQNPIDLDCCAPENQGYFNECDACATLMVGYIPESGLLRFDSMTREVTITCNNITRPAAKNIGTLEGLPFEWFEVGCQEVCLGIAVDCLNTAEDATVSVWRAGREL